MSLARRTMTALPLLAVLVAVVQFAPPWAMFLLLQVFVLGSLIELFTLLERRGLRPKRILGVLFAGLVGLTFMIPGFTLGMALGLCLLVSAFVYVADVTVVEKLPDFPGSLATTLLGAVYLAFPLGYLYAIRLENGPFGLYFLFAVIFLGDSGAYFIGKPFGRHRMTPVASPHKTWEGAAGGILFACLGAVAARALFLPAVPLWKAVATAAAVHAAAQAADPLESLFKRAAGVKDSSNVFPGHGGFLDRIDSFVLAAPFYYYIVKLVW